MRRYPTLTALRAGEVVDLGGILVEMDEGDIKNGDLYVAERNSGPHLLTARKVVWCTCGCGAIDFICPTTVDYPFDGHECVKVREVE